MQLDTSCVIVTLSHLPRSVAAASHFQIAISSIDLHDQNLLKHTPVLYPSNYLVGTTGRFPKPGDISRSCCECHVAVWYFSHCRS
jgi:hypothetical protein